MAGVDPDLLDEDYLRARGLLPNPNQCNDAMVAEGGYGGSRRVLSLYEGTVRLFAEAVDQAERNNADLRRRYCYTGDRLDAARAALEWLVETHELDELTLAVIGHALASDVEG